MLSLDDFEIQEPDPEAIRLSIARSTAQQRHMALLCIEQAKLCRIICKILKTAYSEDPVGHIGTFFTNEEFHEKRAVVSTRIKLDDHKLSICEEELTRWREEVPSEVMQAHPTPSPTDPVDQAPYLHRALLSLLYFAALLSLHRSRASHGENCSKIRYAAAQSNEVVMDLYRADLMRLIPATAISCLIPVAISHLHDMRSPEVTLRREAQRRLEECKQVLRELSDAHIAAEWAINFLSFVESQVKRKERKKMTGMMTGEILWDMQNPQSIPGPSSMFTFSPNENQGSGSGHSRTTTDFDTSTACNDRDRSSDCAAQPAGVPINNAAEKPSVPGLSPDDFSSMINFPEMWLDMAGAQEVMMDTDWMNETQNSANLE